MNIKYKNRLNYIMFIFETMYFQFVKIASTFILNVEYDQEIIYYVYVYAYYNKYSMQ